MTHMNSLELTRPTLLGLLCASGVERIPARTWPVQAALGRVQDRVSATSPVGRVIRQWPRRQTVAGEQFDGLETLLRGLAVSGVLRPSGRGTSAGYDVDESWKDRHLQVLANLSRADQRALADGAQGVVARTTRSSKKPAVVES